MFNPYTLLAAGIVGLALLFGAYQQGAEHARQKATVEFDKHLAADRAFELSIERAAREKEAELAQAQAYVAEAYEQGKRDAEKVAQVVVDDLRAGNLRLRRQWTGAACPERGVSAAPADPPSVDAAAGVREESAGRIVRAAAQCDAQVRGLQQLLVTIRESFQNPSSRR